MIGQLLTFPIRATARAAWSVVSTEPIPTLLFGPEEPFMDEYEPRTLGDVQTITVKLDGETIQKTAGLPGAPVTITRTPEGGTPDVQTGRLADASPSWSVTVDGVELGRWEGSE